MRRPEGLEDGVDRKPPAAARFFDELLLYSGQYALFYILMNFSGKGLGFFLDVGHTAVLASLILQTAVLVRWGHRPLPRLLGSLIAPAIYTLFEMRALSDFVLNIGHLNFWIFSLLTGTLQAAAILSRRLRLKLSLEFLVTAVNVLVFLFLYFLYDLQLKYGQMQAQGTITAVQYKDYLEVYSLGRNMRDFLEDSVHIYVTVGGGILAVTLGLGRVKIARLKERINDLFGRYVDASFRDRIVSGGRRSGEAKEVAILFSDIRGFTGITEGSAAQDVVAMLNVVFSAWDRASRIRGGIIDKFIGDAVMILFEEEGKEDPCARAVRCARAFQEGMTALREDLERGGLPVPSGVGVGVNYGRVILGSVGSSERMNYTAIGDNVNVASRLESACKTYSKGIIVSQPVYDRLPQELRAGFGRMGEIVLKGKTSPTSIYGL